MAKSAGQVVKRGDRTYLVRVPMGTDAKGKRSYHNHTVHGTLKDAQAYLSAALRERDLGTFVEPGKDTLGDYLDKWLAEAAKGRVRGQTFETYEARLRRYVRPALGDRRLCDLTPLDLQTLYGGMTARGLSPQTVRQTHAPLRLALEQAVRWGMLSRNVATLVDLPHQEKREMQALTPEEAQAFLQAAQEDPWRALWALALDTGMRPEEYLALRWSDVDLPGRTVRVQQVLVRPKAGPGYRFEPPKTPKSRRTIPVGGATAKALSAHKVCKARERLAAGVPDGDLGLVFAAENGEPLRLNNLTRRHFKTLLAKAGLSATIRLYDLRHTCATLLLAAGENPKVVSERLGHASVTLTLDTYSHVLPTMQRAAADRLDAILHGGR